MACAECGSDQNPTNQDPLNCDSRFMACNNPCLVRSGTNTAACESLPSQIQNFTDQFFGQVIKTEVNGQVVWSLPCQLDIGLPANPRVAGEGLACYFLRLFRDGIGGLKGDQGNQGDAGTNGHNGYAVVKQSFPHPPPGNPLTQFVIYTNPVIAIGLYVFLPSSGYYQVTDVQPNGVIFATLIRSVASPVSTVPSGTLVIPAGPPGV